MEDISLFNLGLVLSLVPICQGLVQMLKQDSFPPIVTRLLSLVIGVGLVFLVRLAGVEASAFVSNPYMAALSGLVVALISGGQYNMIKSDIVADVVTSKGEVAVPSKLINAEEPGVVVPEKAEPVLGKSNKNKYGTNKAI